MLRVVVHKSAAAAKAYYAEGLKREDYYSEKQEVIGEAGLLGTRDMWRIMKAVGSSTRLLLTGDAQQHAPVARGNPPELTPKPLRSACLFYRGKITAVVLEILDGSRSVHAQ